jgi:ribonuclease HI
VRQPLYVISTDGASRGNPGHAAVAFVIRDPDGRTISSHAEYIGVASNNVAEYTALIRALEQAHWMGFRRVRVHTDSELMVKQFNGAYRVKDERLARLHADAKTLFQAFDAVELRHVPREQNRDADALASDAVRAHLRANPLV